jgi:hypothetical protein
MTKAIMQRYAPPQSEDTLLVVVPVGAVGEAIIIGVLNSNGFNSVPKQKRFRINGLLPNGIFNLEDYLPCSI